MRGILDIKLQLGCLIILLYIVVVYTIQTIRNLKCNKIFDFILAVAPWAVFFDGLTAWTVNQREIVPAWCNLLLHGLFFLFINFTIVGIYVYIIDLTVGLPKKKWHRVAMLMPGIISTGIILAFIGQLEYVDGNFTAYSVGVSPYACFASTAIHFLGACVLMIVRHKSIEKRKKVSTFVFAGFAMAILILQIAFPEILFTSLFPTLVVIGLYFIFENPSIRRMEEINSKMVAGFATLVENRDDNTGGHIQRTGAYVGLILNEMKRSPMYRNVLTKDFIDHMRSAAPLHDIGKISTPDRILQKPGALTDEEYSIMKEHSAVGSEIIKKLFADIDDPEFLDIAFKVARYHHEKWNGKGYPDGLKGEEIPLCARIMAIADVFDAISADRVYRPAMPMDRCFEIIEKGAGEDFDPNLVELFLNDKEAVMKLHG